VIHSDKGTIVHGKSTLEAGADVPIGVKRGERLRVRQEVTLDIMVGEFTYEVGLGMLSFETYNQRGRLTHQELDAQIMRLCLVPSAGQFAVVLRRPGDGVQLRHHGLTNLAGDLRMMLLPSSES
jgi:lipopolysaccharide transport system ATP-binding protein